MAQKYFITGIGTGIGKTIVSAIVTEQLKADYWKPIQSGDLADSDSLSVQKLLSNPNSKIHEEKFRLNAPLSPHLSAKMDGIDIALQDFTLPATENHLIIEGAGGLMVPLNDTHLIIDLIKHLDVQVILVSNNYLGSINHTLLSVNVLKQYGIKIKGIIFNGTPNLESETYILNYTGLTCLGKIPQLGEINKKTIIEAGENLNLRSLKTPQL